MIDMTSLIATGAAFFIVAVTPGPATISNATIAMTYGRKVSLVYAAGLSSGLVFWGLIAATGMGAVLQGSLYLLTILKVLGGMYLLWLAIQSARSVYSSALDNQATAGQQRWFMRGLILNMSNPKSVIAWMAALSIGITADSDTAAVVASTVVCVVVGFATNWLYSYLFSIDGMMQVYKRLYRRINGVVSMLFAVAGFGMIRSAFSD